jgi:hypothetical protein
MIKVDEEDSSLEGVGLVFCELSRSFFFFGGRFPSMAKALGSRWRGVEGPPRF